MKLIKKIVYERRPWNLKGTHLILKEWTPARSLQEIDFSTACPPGNIAKTGN
jgi:hypothetical protein